MKEVEAMSKIYGDIYRGSFRGELVPQDPNDEPASALLERIREERAKHESKKKSRKK